MNVRALVAACLFLSGAGSLVLEVVWTRLLRLTFGSTTLAVSTVLVAYMLGLGLGGLLGGRLASRLRNGVRTYGWMEIGIGLYALAVPSILDLLPALARDVLAELSFWPAAMLRFAVVLAVLVLPTVFMGATLPVLVAALVRGRATLARFVGLLYGVNTMGAVSGVFLATFFLFPGFGVRATNMVGAGLDLLVGGLALALVAPRLAPDASAEAKPGAASPAPSPEAAVARWNPALLAYGSVGFTALVYEVCWTRALSMILGSSIYAFATMLAAFLTGIALGSLIGRRWFDGLRRPLAVYAVGIGVLGCLSVATLFAFRSLPGVFLSLVGTFGASRASIVLTGVLVSMLAMIGPTLVLGALFPLLTRALAADDPSRTVGDVYFANTLGSASGAFLAGFVLIPAFGLRHTMAVAMAINFAAAAAVLLWQRQWRGPLRLVLAGAGVAVAALLLAVPPSWNDAGLTRGVYRFPGELLDVGVELLPLTGVPPEEMIFYREGVNTTVSVHRRFGEVHLRVNGKTDASSGGDLNTQILLGQIPMLFGGRAERVLVIGFASGTTVGSVATHHPAGIDVIELEPAMVEASHFFDEMNGRPLEKPFVHLIADDGRVFLATTREHYDVIISEPSNPWITGASNLFTREFFHAARQALAPGGRLCQWVQLYGIDPARLRSIIAALRAEFPFVYGFHARGEDSDLILVASEKRMHPGDLPDWEKLEPAVRADLERIESLSTADLWTLLRLGAEDIDAIAAAADSINTDDNMAVELESPWRLWDLDLLPENQEVVRQFKRGVLGVAESGGAVLDGETVGRLAVSYAKPREDETMARELAALARARGEPAYADVAEASLAMKADEETSEEVVAVLEGAVRQRPDFFAAHALLAKALNGTGHSAEALEHVDEALRLQPGNLRAEYVRLEILLVLQRSLEARALAESLLQSPFGRQSQLRLYAAAAAADAGQLDLGIREMREAVLRTPGVPTNWALLSRMYDMAGRPQEANAAHANAERAERNLVLTLHQKALREERLASKERAIESLALALSLDPDYEPARRELERLGVALTGEDDPGPEAGGQGSGAGGQGTN